ncbi:glycosyl hydrolase [Vibrio hannami]|uniref:glycosyl hydrolase n=1 Tax=Vibrio hannami TaxID=2717094 RepID=UPI0024107A50|nr:glycosyl hydrolase [Vibrio hannami]MDG3085301.1 glycosyl hydrolase [Vibrio hannami]
MKKIATLALIVSSLTSLYTFANSQLINPESTEETKALYKNLAKLNGKVMFGHEDSLAYGAKWWGYNSDGSFNSDIKEVTGSLPAVFGLDIGGIGLGNEKNLDEVKFSDYKRYIKEVFRLGGVNTISWHMYSPIDQHHSWVKNSYVKELIPGGKHNTELKSYLDAFVAFNEDLKVTIDGKKYGYLSYFAHGTSIMVTGFGGGKDTLQRMIILHFGNSRLIT